MLALLPDHPDINEAYFKCQTQISKLKTYLQQKRSDRTNNDGEILKTIWNAEGDKSLLSSKQIPTLQCTDQLRNHFGKLYALSWFSSDDNKLITASQDAKLIISNLGSRGVHPIFFISLKSSWAMTCCASPSGRHVASAGLDNVVSIFNIENESAFVTWNEEEQKQLVIEHTYHEGYIAATQFIDDHRIISVSGDWTARIFDINKQKCIKMFDYPGDLQSVDVNAEKSLFITGCLDGTAYLNDYRTNISSQHVATFTGHDLDVNSVKWFPDQMAFVSGSDDSTIRLWDIRSYEGLSVYGDDNIYSSVTAVYCSLSGHYIFGGYDESPYCIAWNTLTGSQEQELDHPARVSCLAVSPNGNVLATGCWDTNVRTWSTSKRPTMFDNMTFGDKCLCFCIMCLWSCSDCSCCKACKCCN